MTTLRVGIIGTGFIARTHVDSFRRACLLFRDLDTEVEIVAVADIALQAAQAFASAMSIPKAVDQWQALVTDPAIDLIDIATPNNLHFPIAMAAIEQGKAVYCEKPLSLTREEADTMTAAAKAKGVRTFVAFNNVFAPSTQLAKTLIERGDIGRPVQFTGTFDQGFYSDTELPASWRTRVAEAGSGALGDLGSHVVSIAQYLLGAITSVAALDAIVFKDRPLPGSGMGYHAKANTDATRQRVENDDIVKALVRFESGAFGSIGASRIAAGRVFGINWEIQGTEGGLYVENERANELHVFRMNDPHDERGFKTILCGSQVDGFKQGFFGFDYGGGGIGYFDVKVLEIRGMLKALKNSDEWFCDFAFGRDNQAVVDAIGASAAAGGSMLQV
ncbi:MAG: Gfo/Idh/MocA family oxidoreductase [Devosia sp.]